MPVARPALDQRHAADSYVQVTRESLKLRHLSVLIFLSSKTCLPICLTTERLGQKNRLLLRLAARRLRFCYRQHARRAACAGSMSRGRQLRSSRSREFEAAPSFCSNFPVMDVSNLPFNQAVGITADGSNVVLTPRSQHLNHLNTVHATVVYGVAEAAAGQCLFEHFSDIADSYRVVLRSSNAKYRRPALMGADLRAAGTVAAADAAAFNQVLRSRGRASLEVSVSVTQDETELFVGKFCWFAKKAR